MCFPRLAHQRHIERTSRAHRGHIVGTSWAHHGHIMGTFLAPRGFHSIRKHSLVMFNVTMEFLFYDLLGYSADFFRLRSENGLY